MALLDDAIENGWTRVLAALESVDHQYGHLACSDSLLADIQDELARASAEVVCLRAFLMARDNMNAVHDHADDHARAERGT